MKRKVKDTQQHILEHWLVDYFWFHFFFFCQKNYTTLSKQHFCSIQTKNWIGFKSTWRNENTAWKNSLHNKCKNSIRVLNSNFKFLPSSKKIYIFNAQNYIQPVTFLLPQWIENFFVYTNASLLIIFTFSTQKCKQNNKSCANEEFLEILRNWE